jgi:hypothetical protein
MLLVGRHTTQSTIQTDLRTVVACYTIMGRQFDPEAIISSLTLAEKVDLFLTLLLCSSFE